MTERVRVRVRVMEGQQGAIETQVMIKKVVEKGDSAPDVPKRFGVSLLLGE